MANPKGYWDLVYFRSGYYLAKFAMKEDHKFVMDEGPWTIFGHYLTMRQWQPSFDTAKATIESTAVWVRFPALPISY